VALGDNYAAKVPTGLGIKSKAGLNQRFLRIIRERAQGEPLSVLEAGVGHGFFAKACVAAGHEFWGVESNRLLFESLRDKGIRVKHCKCPPLPFDTASFDVVYAGYFVEFLPDAATVFEFFEECHRVLKPGGILAVVSSDYTIMGNEFWNVSYLASFATTERRLGQAMYDAGLTHEQSIFFAGNLFGPSRYLAYLFYRLYPHNLLNRLLGQNTNLNSRIYKLRVSFAEGMLLIGSKKDTPDAPRVIF